MKFDTLDECGPEILTNEAATRKLTDSEGTLMEDHVLDDVFLPGGKPLRSSLKGWTHRMYN